jgi:hypothetical protein
MSDYRNPDDRLRDPDMRTRNAASGWIAGGVFLVIIIGLAFGVGHMPNHGNTSAPAINASTPATQQPPTTGPATRTYSPASPAPITPEQNPAQGPTQNTAPAQP